MESVMVNAIRNNNLNFLAKKELGRLHITHPDPQQILVMKAILSERGALSTKLIYPNELTERELACLIWITRGKNSKYIARELNMPYATVRSHLHRIKQKLNAMTMAQAVYEAIKIYYILPKDFIEELN